MTIKHLFLRISCLGIAGGLLWFGAGGFWADPYSPDSTVAAPFLTKVDQQGLIQLIEVYRPQIRDDWFSHLTAFGRAGVRIFLYRWIGEPSLGNQETAIISQLHRLRFNPTQPYLITGAHYSDLYIRNLGIFYNELLNGDAALSQDDWLNRQRIALQTVALDLEFLHQEHHLVTTIVPLGGESFTGINIYAEPSDALYGVLFELRELERSGMESEGTTRQLQAKYYEDLRAEVRRYLETVLDPQTHFIKKDIHLSSARDGVQRQSAFYDNVIAWKTVQLAQRLNLMNRAEWAEQWQFLFDASEWKQQILNAYWSDTVGYFKNGLQDDSFSADSLIVFQTNFLDLNNQDDLKKAIMLLQTVHTQSSSRPFPLSYTLDNKSQNFQPMVGMFARSYASSAIWSHWGIEYAKALILLSQQLQSSESCRFLDRAHQTLTAYQKNMVQTGGYPELYAADGSEFRQPVIKSVLHSGWVVNYEAAQAEFKIATQSSHCVFPDHLLQY